MWYPIQSKCPEIADGKLRPAIIHFTDRHEPGPRRCDLGVDQLGPASRVAGARVRPRRVSLISQTFEVPRWPDSASSRPEGPSPG